MKLLIIDDKEIPWLVVDDFEQFAQAWIVPEHDVVDGGKHPIVVIRDVMREILAQRAILSGGELKTGYDAKIYRAGTGVRLEVCPFCDAGKERADVETSPDLLVIDGEVAGLGPSKIETQMRADAAEAFAASAMGGGDVESLRALFDGLFEVCEKGWLKQDSGGVGSKTWLKKVSESESKPHTFKAWLPGDNYDAARYVQITIVDDDPPYAVLERIDFELGDTES